MKSRKGFTLIELMVVILIVGILAAVALPIMRGRIDSAKWSEANAAAGMIRQAVRAYVAEHGPTYASYPADLEGAIGVFGGNLGIVATDLDGRYFNNAAYVIDALSVDATTGACSITVTAAAGGGGPGGAPSNPATRQLTVAGDWQ